MLSFCLGLKMFYNTLSESPMIGYLVNARGLHGSRYENYSHDPFTRIDVLRFHFFVLSLGLFTRFRRGIPF